MCKINGRKLGEIRENAGMSQKELAEKLGVTPGTISHYENGDTNPSDENVKRICMILKISDDDIKIQGIDYSFTSGESKTVKSYRTRNKGKRCMNPIELEAMIKNYRSLPEEKEKVFVNNVVTKESMKVGNKHYIFIDPTMIHIPLWQRNTDMAKTEEIRKNFDENKFDPIKAYYYNGLLYVGDGAHRLIAFILNNSELPEEGKLKIQVELLECTNQEALKIFLEQGSGRKAMSVGDMYRAGIQANIEDYICFKNIFSDHNIQITSELNRLDNPIGIVSPSRTMLRISKNKRDLLDDALCLIEDLNWCGSDKNAFVLRTINTLIKLFAKNGYDRTRDALMEKCKGATYYESKIFPVKSNAELYDMLEEEIK